MRYSSRVFLYAPLGILLLLAAAAMANWWIAARALSARLDVLNGHDIMPGVRVSFASRHIAGFPFRLDLLLDKLRVEVAEADGPIVWTSDNFAMHELTYGRRQAIFEAANRQSLSWSDAEGGHHRFVFLPGTFRASAILEGGALERFDAQIADLDGSDFRAGNAEIHFRANHRAIDAYLKIESAHIPLGYAAALGPDLEAMTATASIDRSDKLAGMLHGIAAPAVALSAWSDAGGKVLVGRLSARWKTRSAGFSGRLTLDRHHALHGRLTGFVMDTRTQRRSAAVLEAEGNRLKLQSGLSGS